jgi:anti-sigma B factor antagonist
MLQDLQIADYALDSRTHVIEVEGQIDLYAAPEFKERTARVIEGGAKCVIIDLSRVTFMDSTGLGVLVGALKRIRAARADLLLVVTDYDIERLFELTGLDGTFRIYRSRDDALEQLAANRGDDA